MKSIERFTWTEYIIFKNIDVNVNIFECNNGKGGYDFERQKKGVCGRAWTEKMGERNVVNML